MENIAIVMGGYSEEKDISLQSGETIYTYIDLNKYTPYKVICRNKNKFHVILNSEKIEINNKDFSFLRKNKQVKFDKVFMMIHGKPGENGQLCSFFESKKIPYTSSGQISSELTFNKFKCNKHLKQLGYTVPESNIFTKKDAIKYPSIIKPIASGSSFGINKVNNKQELKQAIDQANKYSDEIIVEEFIDGRELTCGVFSISGKVKALPITEIISENEIFDYDAKYNGKSTEETPAKINSSVRMKIEDISKKIYRDLKLSGVIRVDFIMKDTQPYIIEINTIPGFSEKSIVPQMLKSANINIRTFISEQLENI
tara:strand:- start:101 stop:1039 length:939 start_codon:yes stop_codon:yes gene_type:complete